MRKAIRLVTFVILIGMVLGACAPAATPTVAGRLPGVPAPGESPMIDKILERGKLRVGALVDPPWLGQDTSTGEWFGPAWTLASEIAKRLGVPIEIVETSHDTKITGVVAGTFDISISPMWATAKRLEITDFVTYAYAGTCYYALQSNAKVNTLEDLNNAEVVAACISGSPQADMAKADFPNITTLEVIGQPGSATAVDEVLSGRADIAGFDSIRYWEMLKAYPQMKFFPAGEECVNKPLQPIATGMAINKGDPVFLKFMMDIKDELQAQLTAEEQELARNPK